jgi:hypothetical protein
VQKTVPTPKPFSSVKPTTVGNSGRPKHRPLLDPKQKIVILPTSRRLSYS